MRIIIPLIVLLTIGCQPKQKGSDDTQHEQIAIEYAKKFRLYDKSISVLEPWPGATKEIRYEIGETPKKIICTSTTHLPFLELLGVANTLVGFPGTQYITSENIRKSVEDGSVKDVGGEGSLNLEMIIGLDPDLVFAFDMGNESTVLDKLEESGIPVVYNSDFLETSTLGRAEWIKFFGAFFHKQSAADSIFDVIKSNYDSLLNLAKNVEVRPEILSGVLYGDIWFLPGGKNWSAQFFNDAGGQYFLENNEKTGWLELGFEYVFEEAKEADFWIGLATFQTKEELADQDSRYAQFDAFKHDQIYNYSKRIGAKGGYDIFESGYARPDRVLADMIKIIHPELLPDYETYYFEQLP
ncbi:MAG: ABC transporter substrate-binding protein [Cyclobacteriaceae bacterium]